MVLVCRAVLVLDGELVNAPRAHRRCSLAAEQQVLRQYAVAVFIAMGAVVEARNVDDGRETVGQHAVYLVHATGHRTCRILTMADVLKEFRHAITVGTALRGHLVADAPHHHARVVAVVSQHVYHVFLSPIIEKTVVSVLTFRHVPFVERLDHHHHSELVAQLHEFRSRHVVRCAYGVAAHVLEHKDLMPQCRAVHGCAQRTEVVMVAHALELALPAVEEEALVGHELNASYAEARGA